MFPIVRKCLIWLSLRFREPFEARLVPVKVFIFSDVMACHFFREHGRLKRFIWHFRRIRNC